MSGAPYVPVEISLGTLPEFGGEEKEYDLTGAGVPAEAKAILVYTFVTVKGVSGDFQRGYYEISTSDEDNQYEQYMNVATGDGITVLNSANLWFPMGADGKLTAKLICAECQEGHKSIKGETPVSGEWSEVFIIGYREAMPREKSL